MCKISKLLHKNVLIAVAIVAVLLTSYLASLVALLYMISLWG